MITYCPWESRLLISCLIHQSRQLHCVASQMLELVWQSQETVLHGVSETNTKKMLQKQLSWCILKLSDFTEEPQKPVTIRKLAPNFTKKKNWKKMSTGMKINPLCILHRKVRATFLICNLQHDIKTLFPIILSTSSIISNAVNETQNLTSASSSCTSWRWMKAINLLQ